MTEMVQPLTPTHYVPRGQRLLQAGFTQVTEAQLRDLMGCDEIQRLEDAMVEAEARLEVLRKDATATHITIHVRPDGMVSATWEAHRWHGMVHQDCYLNSQRRIVGLKYIELDHYIDQVIPDEIMQKIQTAIDLGVTHIQVVVPVLREVRHRDPVVVGRLGISEMFLIGQWG